MKHRKHSNQVRIIGGTHRGSLLSFCDAEGLRPTADSVKEKLFNWLGQDLTGLTVLDVFAGSGALGFEAASRNARKVCINEKNIKVFRDIEENKKRLKFNNIQLSNQDAFQFLKQNTLKFDVIFLDPPFAFVDWSSFWDLLSSLITLNSMIYLEAGSLPEIPDWLEVIKQGKSGKSNFVLLETIQDMNE